jgi:hypothetical protein
LKRVDVDQFETRLRCTGLVGAPSGVRLVYLRFLLITHRALRELYQAQIRDQRVWVVGRASVQEVGSRRNPR